MISIGEVVDDSWYIHKMEYYSTIKTYKGFVTVWKKVHIRQHKSKIQKHRCTIISTKKEIYKDAQIKYLLAGGFKCIMMTKNFCLLL